MGICNAVGLGVRVSFATVVLAETKHSRVCRASSRERFGWTDLADLLDRQRLPRDDFRVVKILSVVILTSREENVLEVEQGREVGGRGFAKIVAEGDEGSSGPLTEIHMELNEEESCRRLTVRGPLIGQRTESGTKTSSAQMN